MYQGKNFVGLIAEGRKINYTYICIRVFLHKVLVGLYKKERG